MGLLSSITHHNTILQLLVNYSADWLRRPPEVTRKSRHNHRQTGAQQDGGCRHLVGFPAKVDFYFL